MALSFTFRARRGVVPTTPVLAALLALLLQATPRAQSPAAGPKAVTDGLAALVAAVASSSDTALQRDILRGVAAAFRDRRTAPMPEGWDSLEPRLAKSELPEIRALAEQLGLLFGSPAATASLRAAALDPGRPATERQSALDALIAAHTADLGPSLIKLIGDPVVRGAALRGLAAYQEPETAAIVLAAYSTFDAGQRRDALNTLASRAVYARPLVAAVGDGLVPKSELTADLVRQLRALRDTALNGRLDEIWGVMHDTSPDMLANVEKYKRVYWAGGSTPGNAPRGRAVFNRICAQCHHLFDTGGKVGPDITGANRGDLDYLLQNILYPNAVIPNEYRATSVETKDGRVIVGIVKSQTGAAVSLQTANELVTLQKADIDKMETLETSMMPEGLIANLPEQEVRDLLYYLSRPGQVPLPAGS